MMAISNIKLIVGLGNPEDKYTNTRHNIGYKVIDNLIEQYYTWPSINYFNNLFEGDICIGYKQSVLMLKPTTGMNSSGISVAKTVKKLNIQPSQILVIHDDISLPIGTIRVREAGSSGGHKGVQSIIDHLGTQDFNRVKVGIDKPSSVNLGKLKESTQSIIDYVLSEETNIEATNTSIKGAANVINNILNGLIKEGNTFKYDN